MSEKIEKRNGADEKPKRPHEEKAVWLRTRIPKTMEVLSSGSLNYSVVDELYAALNPFGGALPADVNDTLGQGFADMIDSESMMEDGGVFGTGGVTGGGIFGGEPVATSVYDPAARQRSEASSASRALLAEPEASDDAPPKLPPHRRRNLLR